MFSVPVQRNNGIWKILTFETVVPLEEFNQLGLVRSYRVECGLATNAEVWVD
jgi:hypothetical protein